MSEPAKRKRKTETRAAWRAKLKALREEIRELKHSTVNVANLLVEALDPELTREQVVRLVKEAVMEIYYPDEYISVNLELRPTPPSGPPTVNVANFVGQCESKAYPRAY
jgi:hypothetical protein